MARNLRGDVGDTGGLEGREGSTHVSNSQKHKKIETYIQFLSFSVGILNRTKSFILHFTMIAVD